jgi:DNA-binding NarL/FixJ family response regulator
MKILIADDHSVVREGLKTVVREGLKSLPGGFSKADIIEEAQDGIEAFKKISSGEFDFVILDISMPGMSGLDILKALKSRNIKCNILILSVFPQGQYAIRALELGASGYISKNSASEELAIAIKKISAGKKYISSDVIGKLISNVKSQDNKEPHEKLSEREFQIMNMLAKGLSNIEIGKILFISGKTVSTYRTRILEKMGMKSNTELALYSYKNNLIE